VPAEIAALTTVLDYNDVAGLERAFAEIGKEIAAVIVEPVAGNMNLIMPKPEFLAAMRKLCTAHGAVLILDEVMTGFRVSLQGAQGYFGIMPDLTTLARLWRWFAGSGVRRAPRHHAVSGATGCGVSGWYFVRQPDCGGGRHGDLKLVQAAGFYERLSKTATQLTQV